MSVHTPTPWFTYQSHIHAPDGAVLAQVHNPGSKEADYPLRANAAFIVLAVNSHNNLVEALEAVVVVYKRDNPIRTADLHDPSCTCMRCAIDNAEAALAAAKGHAL